MIQALSELHPIHVVSPVSWLDEFSHYIKHKAPLNREWLPVESSGRLSAEYPRFYYLPKILHQHYGQFLYWSIKKSLHQAITAFQPDIILSYWLHPDGAVAVRVAQEHGLPVVTMTGGSDILLLTKNRQRKRAIKTVLQQADGVITVSDDIMSAVKQLKIHPDKIHTIYRGVNRSLFTPGDQQAARQRLGLPLDRKIIVSVGRLEPVKGHTVLLDACLKISKQGIPFTCYVLGEGSLEATLLQKIKEYGLEGLFQLNGSQQQSRLADWYRAADVIALPSLSEGIPNVLLEAISCGKQFVASRVGGIPEIADPVCDQLVPPNDPEELAEAICSMFSNPIQSETRSFEPISWQESAVQISQILSDCSTRFSSGLTNKQKSRSSYRRKKRRIRR
ncbi:glycosyltransferase [uncultured Gimesia sp.]|uniref:glycosyltransferase n=1 Tax=uncultured Gimesia sp. TaxID=1678688 RepID=UPI0030D937CF|tara:strand:+ start:49334 stop:50506 length:1173 start_codon:yes stop_codon:yes gene_type:complete